MGALCATVLFTSPISARAQNAFTYSVLHGFEDPARSPSGSMFLGAGGVLYGTTRNGGVWGFGTVFKVHADGSGYAVLHEFQGTDGAFPVAGVIQASDGLLYGITDQGGPAGCASTGPGSEGACQVLFKIAADGAGFQQIHVFNNGGGGSGVIQGTDGFLYGISGSALFKVGTDGSGFSELYNSFSNSSLPSGLIQGSDGNLYGTFPSPVGLVGAVFRIATDGQGFAILHPFYTGAGIDPVSLVEGADGALYGTTRSSASGAGVVFKLSTDGTGFTVLHEFGTGAGVPIGSLAEASWGVLYGTTSQGGAAGAGVIFKIGTDGTGFTTVRQFSGADGAAPLGGLVRGAGGTLLGTTSAGGLGNRGRVFEIASDGSGFRSVHDFDGSDPANPTAALIQGTDGALYGITPDGGAYNQGTVFRMEADGPGFGVLHDFDGSDGASPVALLQATDGFLYGAASNGGTLKEGTLFRLATNGGGFAKLFDFGSSTGSMPTALIQASDGDLYGTTRRGGSASWGVLFRMSTDGSGYSFLHEFDDNSGGGPTNLLQGSDGALYGTTHWAGVGGSAMRGTLFTIARNGSAFFELYNFALDSPPVALAQAPDGTLYVTTAACCTSAPPSGTVFKIRPNGSGFVMLHTFDGPNGKAPTSGPIFGADGALYGTTAIGGGHDSGVVYRMNADGTGFSLIHDFAGGVDGARPFASVALGVDGALYGSTYLGGSGGGVLFRLATQTLSLSSANVVEGDSGTGSAVVTVSLASPAALPVTVRYDTVNGTAVSGTDYVATSGVLTFAPGETRKTIEVTVLGDTLHEGDETFTVRLSLPTNATIATDEGLVTIVDDDPPPTLSINSVSAEEGNAGSTNLLFTVALSNASGLATTVHYETADVTATAGVDYVATAGTLTIPAGGTSGAIAVGINGDSTYEGDETFDVVLSAPSNATIQEATGVGTIVDDDGIVKIEFASPRYSVNEVSGKALISVIRNSVAGPATVSYTTLDGTATAGVDYQPTLGTLTFTANRRSGSFAVPIANDSVHTGARTVLLRLSNPQPSAQGAALGPNSTAVLTIDDNDFGGRVGFASAETTVHESAGTVKLTVRRAGGLASGVSVRYATSAGTAMGGGVDYTDTSGYLTFAPSGAGASVQTITIPITEDTLPEGAESFQVALDSPTGGATLGSTATATVTILDDEPTLEFTSSTYSATESQPFVRVAVRRSGPLSGVVAVSYAMGGGTATPAADYKARSGTLTFADGVSTRTFVVPIVQDSLVEGPETVGISLGSPVGIRLGGQSAATVTIRDDDSTPTLRFGAASYQVSEAARQATVVVKRTGALTDVVTVDYQATGGTATNGGVDYTLTPGTLTFDKGVTTQTIRVPILNDSIEEGTKTADVQLGNPQNLTDPGHAALGAQSTTTLYITDNEPTVQFSAAAYSVSEALRSVSVTVRRFGGLGSPATVDYQITGGSAVSGTDYTLAPSGTVSFSAGQSVRTIPVTLIPDTVADGSRTIVLELTNAAGAGLGTPAATTVTIKDDDRAGKAQFGAASYAVAEIGGSATITVSRSGGVSSAATVDYSTSNGSAVAGSDYDTVTGTLTFGPNEASKTFTVPVHDDGISDSGAVSVDLTLDSPQNGLALGSPSQATLWIVRE